MTFQAAPEIVSADFTIRSMLLNLRDDVIITLPGYNDTNMQIRGMAKDWNKLNNRLTLWNVPSFKDVGRYTADSQRSIYAATIQQRNDQGFWMDDNSTPGRTNTLFDSFTGSAGTEINARLMDRGGTWLYDSIQQVDDASFELVPDGMMVNTNGDNSREYFAIAGSSLSDAYVRCDMYHDTGFGNSRGGIVFRWQDRRNHWRIDYDSQNRRWTLHKIRGGVKINMHQEAQQVNDGITIALTISMIGDSIEVETSASHYPGHISGNKFDITDSFLQSQTFHGLFNNNHASASRFIFNNFEATPALTLDTASYWY